MNLDQKLDNYFGIHHQILNGISKSLYPEISNEALSTSYRDYFQMLKYIGADEKLIDLGAGYCRGSLLSTLFKSHNCISFELLYERTKYAKQFIGAKAKELIIEENLLNRALTLGKYYYCYLPKDRVFYEILRKLLIRSLKEEIFLFVCESHGENIKLCDSLELETIKQFKLAVPRHYDYINLYKIKLDSYNDDDLSRLTLWYILHFDQDFILEFEYEHLILEDKVSLYIHLNELDLNLLGEQACFENAHTGRVYSNSRGFKLKRVFSAGSDKRITSLLAKRDNLKDKLIKLKNFYIEDISGQLSPL